MAICLVHQFGAVVQLAVWSNDVTVLPAGIGTVRVLIGHISEERHLPYFTPNIAATLRSNPQTYASSLAVRSVLLSRMMSSSPLSPLSWPSPQGRRGVQTLCRPRGCLVSVARTRASAFCASLWGDIPTPHGVVRAARCGGTSV